MAINTYGVDRAQFSDPNAYYQVVSAKAQAERERENDTSSGKKSSKSKWGKLIYGNTATPYLDQYKETSSELNKQANTDISNMNTRMGEDLAKSNAAYDNTARQNWVNYMQAQKKLPSQLNSLGIRGGASESSLLRLGTNYGTNVASNEAARVSAANDIRRAYADQIAEREKARNEALMTASATAKENQLKYEREQIDKDLQYFSGAIEGLYKSKKSYKKLIAKLKASDDPNKEYKIMLARKAMNQLSDSGSGSGSSRGSRRSGGYGSGGSGSGSDSGSGSGSGSSVTDSMNEYRKANYKSRSTTTKKKSSGYHIKGESSTNWQ